jgi:PAS domain S-box-containing protein
MSDDEGVDRVADGGAISADHFRLLVASLRDYAVFMLDPEGRVATWNAGARAIKGYAPEEIIGRHLSTFYTAPDREAGRPDALLRAARTDGRVEDEGWRVRKDGTRFWADIVITALRDASGRLVGYAKVTRDLTARKDAEERLRHTQELLSATLYSIGDGVLATDAEGRVVLINAVAERLTGWTEAEAFGKPIEEVFHIINEDTREKAANPITRVLMEGVIVGLANHTALIAKDGVERPIADSGAPIRDASGATRGAVLVFRDVTHERRADAALRQAEERQRLMIASVQDYAICMLDTEGRVVSWNPSAERIKGYRDHEIVGQHFSLFFSEEDRRAGKPERELERAAIDGRFEDESWRVRKDGTRFWANVVVGAVRDGSGALVGFTKVTRDLTERRRVEEERLRLVQAQEALRLRDEFLSIASHELKTPLTALQLQLRGVWERVQPVDETLADKLERAMRAGERLAHLIESLLDVSRIASGRLTLNREEFDLNDAARDVIERLGAAAANAGCELVLETDGAVEGTWDRLRLEQVLTNLVGNALRYAPGAPVTVSIAAEASDAVVRVRDRGPGIPPEDIERIFDRFERASALSHSGLGLGLYIASQVAEAHGGTILAENCEHGGARFVLRLPRGKPPSSPPPR